MKIALAQQNYLIGDFEGNQAKIIAALEQARSRGADVVVFSELCVCGYPPQDLLEYTAFVRRCEQAVRHIAEATRGISALIGAPSVNPKPEGKDLFNSAYLLHDGHIAAIRHKSLLPNYDVFDEYRYFEPNSDFQTVQIGAKKAAVTICEDIWNVGNNPLYRISPLDYLDRFQPGFLINISASPFDLNKAAERINLISGIARNHRLPVFYCNCVGGHTDLIFDGGSLVAAPNGSIVDECLYFAEDLRIYDLDYITNYQGPSLAQQPLPVERLYDALVFGIREYFKKMNMTQALVGLSGGIDSAVVATLAVAALGSHAVHALLLPSPFTSQQSLIDAAALAYNLKIQYDIVPISGLYEQAVTLMQPLSGGKGFDITEENLQARLRCLLLMAYANKHGYILLNTSNKSELATGYGTLYGDLAGGLSVLGDVYKTQVYQLARWINRNGECIPWTIVQRAPTAELKPGQLDTDSLPPYDVLDHILEQHIEHRKGRLDLINKGYDPALVNRVLDMVSRSEFKRRQAPPVLRVSAKAFGSGRRMPIVASYADL
ncbi:MAG: NAD+ synthase [Chitinophagales bacterium]|nr:NAD+ synthase [Chitinophagales bacterium]MDW8428815.1 NAD+ synthase [Chitinophagales bacterium]